MMSGKRGKLRRKVNDALTTNLSMYIILGMERVFTNESIMCERERKIP